MSKASDWAAQNEAFQKAVEDQRKLLAGGVPAFCDPRFKDGRFLAQVGQKGGLVPCSSWNEEIKPKDALAYAAWIVEHFSEEAH